MAKSGSKGLLKEIKDSDTTRTAIYKYQEISFMIEFKNRTVCFLILVSIILSCRENKNIKIERKKIGKYYVEAAFKSDTVLDGVVNFFDQNEKLVSVTNYVDGSKNGPAINYYENGNKRDSMNFNYNLKNGYQYQYDSSGRLSSMNYQYYGLKMGPQLILEDGQIKSYYYTDFNKEDLIDCRFDSSGKFNELRYFTTKPGFEKIVRDGAKMLELIVHSPNPPNSNMNYNVGIIKKSGENLLVFPVNKNRVIFDTILSCPKSGEHYFISTEIKSLDLKVNKVFIEEIKDSL